MACVASWSFVAHIRALWQPICLRAPLIPYDGLKASTRTLGLFLRRGHSRLRADKRERCGPRGGAVGWAVENTALACG